MILSPQTPKNILECSPNNWFCTGPKVELMWDQNQTLSLADLLYIEEKPQKKYTLHTHYFRAFIFVPDYKRNHLRKRAFTRVFIANSLTALQYFKIIKYHKLFRKLFLKSQTFELKL